MHDIAPEVASAASLHAAAEGGDAAARVAWGEHLEKGDGGIAQDYGKAAHWYDLAASRQHRRHGKPRLVP